MANMATILDRIERRIKALHPEGPANRYVGPPGTTTDPKSLPTTASPRQHEVTEQAWEMDDTIPGPES